MKRRNTLLAVDTAVIAATNALVLLLGARLIPSDQLTSLAMYQLLVATAVGLQRATILSPALAAQKQEGATKIPLHWIVLFTIPLTLISAFTIPLLVGAEEPYPEMLGLGLICTLPALTQDLLRYAQFSRRRIPAALLSDVVWLVSFLAGLTGLVFVGDPTWFAVACVWGVSGYLAVAIVLISLMRPLPEKVPDASIRATMRLGRWSGGDAALSGLANLLPMAIATLVLGSTAAATYRVLQTASGPLNILSATFLTSFGLDSWKLQNLAGLKQLRARTVKAITWLGVGSLIYYAIAFPALALISGIDSGDLIRVALILGFAGVLGALTIPLNAAAMSMGYQKIGLIVRVLIVGFAFGISILSAGGFWVPWNDPIGTVTLLSAIVGLAGWTIGYERGYRRETDAFGG